LLAESVAAAVKGLTEPTQFGLRASELKGTVPDIELRLEELPPVASDGRTVPLVATDPPAATFDMDFATAATKLQAAGDQSPVVESRFGFHVILAIEVIPEKRVDEAMRRELFSSEAFAVRAAPELGSTLTRLRTSTPTEIVRDVDQLTLEAWTRQ
jgi:hypothetical protein